MNDLLADFWSTSALVSDLGYFLLHSSSYRITFPFPLNIFCLEETQGLKNGGLALRGVISIDWIVVLLKWQTTAR